MIELNSYFNPLSPEVYASKDSWGVTQLGSLIDFHTEISFPEVKFAEIAIFNISEYLLCVSFIFRIYYLKLKRSNISI